MRTNLKSFLARLALIALITLGVNVRLSAHDLPVDRSLTEDAPTNCFTLRPACLPLPPLLLAIVKFLALEFFQFFESVFSRVADTIEVVAGLGVQSCVRRSAVDT